MLRAAESTARRAVALSRSHKSVRGYFILDSILHTRNPDEVQSRLALMGEARELLLELSTNATKGHEGPSSSRIAQGWSRLAQWYTNGGHYAQASECLRQALALNPGQHARVLLLDLGASLVREGDARHAEAAGYLKRGLSMSPGGDPRAEELLAVCVAPT